MIQDLIEITVDQIKKVESIHFQTIRKQLEKENTEGKIQKVGNENRPLDKEFLG